VVKVGTISITGELLQAARCRIRQIASWWSAAEYGCDTTR